MKNGLMNEREMLQKIQDMLGLKQKELGVYIGVSTRTINSWMTGERQCPEYVAEMALRIALIDAKAYEIDEPTSGMYRWAVVDQRGNGDEFLTVCGSKADALREAEAQWRHLTIKERESRIRFLVGLVHVSLTDGEYDGSRFSYYIDDSGKVDGDVYELAKTWLE